MTHDGTVVVNGRRGTLPTLLALILITASSAAEPVGQANSRVQKQVSLIVEPGRVIASNARLSRVDPLELAEDERVIEQSEARAVLIVVTNFRLLGYGPVAGWHDLPLEPGERIVSLAAQDYAAFIRTTERYLNFNAATGQWAELPRTSQ